jgi:glycosyltransferase involved in cell wall biosynthesis
MINVAFMLDGFHVGGTELHCVRVAEAIDPSRIRLHIAHIHETGPLMARYRALGVPMRHFPIRGLMTAGAVRAGWNLARQLRAWRIDTLHSHDIYGNILGVPWARLAGVPHVVASRRWWDSVPRPGLATMNRHAYSLAHHVVANAPSVARLLSVEDGVPAAKVMTLENFLAEEAFAIPSRTSVLARRRELGLDPERLTVGMVARLAPVKNIPMLLRAVRQLAVELPEVQVALAGDGPSRAELEREVMDSGLQSHVRFLGTVPNQPSVHALFDVSVLTSDSEGFPNSVAEALAVGTPVIATAVGGVPDVIEHGVTGLLVGRGDVDALAAALSCLLRDTTARTALGERGRELARQRFHVSDAIRALEEFYERGTRAGTRGG